ncbi:MAG: twitching motility protein PilT [Myxococcales bacterium]|nr:twitching motility protein PilT [Myxococcales bacterium]
MASEVWRTLSRNDRIFRAEARSYVFCCGLEVALSNLVPLFNMLEKAQADELRLTPGQPPSVALDGQRRDVASQPMNERLILAAASDLLSQAELADLPSARPRTVRHEHGDVLYVIEIARTAAGIGMVIRPAKSTTPQRIQLPRDMPKDLGPRSRRSRQMRAPSNNAIQLAAMPRGQAAAAAAAAQPAAAQPAAGADPTKPTITFKKTGTLDEEVEKSPTPAPAARADAFRAESPRADAPRVETPRAEAARGGGAKIDTLLREMMAAKASDLHLSSGNHPVMRVHGEIHFSRDREVLTSAAVAAFVQEIMNDKAKKDFAELHDADFAYEIPGLGRFRINVFEDRNGVGAVMRQIPIEIITADKLGLPKACMDLCWLSKGLVVVTGPTGSGMSTTLAAMIDYINKNRSDHIITIEDPVEFVHKNIKCLVNQREVGQHTKSFKNALRAALREDPDIVLVGEMRDLETIAIAIETAETGHLVFGTLHTTTAVSTVDRIIDQFPTDRQAQIRVMLSESLKGVVAQVLCKKIGGGRVAAHEIVLGSPAVTSLIRDGKTFQLASVMQTSKNVGMVTMNDSLLALVQSKQVDPKEAWLKATDKTGLLMMFKQAGLPSSFA